MTERTVYIYALINPITNNVFYIGASINPEERLKTHIYHNHDKSLKEKQIKNILRCGKYVELLILEESVRSNAKYLEDFYINLFRFYGFTLLQTNASAYPKEERKKISITNKTIIEKISHGYTVRKIAIELNISPYSIEKRIRNLRKIYSCRNAVHLMTHFMREKIIE